MFWTSKGLTLNQLISKASRDCVLNMIYLDILLAVFSTVLIKYGPVTLMAFEATAILRTLKEANPGEETICVVTSSWHQLYNT